VNAGQLTHYPGGYQYYLDKTKALSARAALTADGRDGFHSVPNLDQKNRDAVERVPPTSRKKEQKRLEAEQRQARSRVRKAQQQIVHKLEKEIGELEQKQTELTTELEKQETYETPGRAMQINRELVEVQKRLGELNPNGKAGGGAGGVGCRLNWVGTPRCGVRSAQRADHPMLSFSANGWHSVRLRIGSVRLLKAQTYLAVGVWMPKSPLALLDAFQFTRGNAPIL